MLARENLVRAIRAIKELLLHGDLTMAELTDNLWELVQRKIAKKKQTPANDTHPKDRKSDAA